MSVNKFISSSMFLFLTKLVDAAGGWIYWLVISKFASTSEIGQATTIYSLILLIGTITQLGLEYPLLKNSSINRSHILGTSLVIEVVITVAALPIVIIILNNLYQEPLQRFAWIAYGILIFGSVWFVSHFVLLGISNGKSIFVIDTIGTGIKFAIGYVLVTIGLGAFGILISFLVYFLWLGGLSLVLAYKIFGFKLGEMSYVKEVVRDGLINMPSNLSKVFIFSLSVVLLASFGIASSEIGVFYIALMISLVGGSLVSSMAYMVLPASSVSKIDLSLRSARIGLSLTAPIIAALIVSPKFILSIVGVQYVSAEATLVILSIGILPFSVVMNAVSKFNYLGHSRKLLFIGSVQVLTFLLAFSLLVPYYGIFGAALSILIAFIASFMTSLIWSERALMRYVANSVIAIFVGWLFGHITDSLASSIGINHPVVVLTSITVTLVVVIALRNISANEIRVLLKIIVKRRSRNS